MDIINAFKQKFGIEQQCFNLDIIKSLFDIIQEIRTQYKIVKSLASLVQKLPDNSISGKIMEQELITRYLEPVLSSLLDDPAEDAFFRWTATINEECRSANAIAISKKRSDSCISYLDECSWEPMQGFGEIKCHGEADNKHAIGKDLLRLGIFAKNAIDTHNLDSILVFQAIRRRIFFYIVTLENAVMYVMFEIGEVEVPARLLGLACYIEQINVLLDMLYIYDQLCHTADNDRSVTLQQ